jgi:N-sulfoglucosamine sulfohydrolase
MTRSVFVDRRNFIKSTSGLILLAGATPWPEALAKTLNKSPKRNRPMNFLFMTADDMNGSMPGWMGNPLKPTPNMDAFAATAHRFIDNHDAAPICQPSREAMMTGLWPQRSGGLGFNPINEGVPTLATVLKGKGYFIAAFNKLEHMQPACCFPWDYSTNDSGRNPPMIEVQVAEAIKQARAQGKPFFINCNTRDPHRPWPRLNKESRAEGEGEQWAINGSPIDDVVKKVTPEQVPVPSFLEDLPPIREELATYYNSVQRLDLSFGKVMAALQASGEMGNTVILFVSDHGMPFPFSKATCYRNGSWCPATIRWPGMGSPRIISEMTQSIDIMPTVLEVLGLERPTMDGRSWMPLIRGEKQENRDYIINNVNGVASGNQFPMRVAQTKKSAFVITPWSDGKNRLFGIDSMSGLSLKAMVEAAKTNPRLKKRVDQYVSGYPMAFYDLEKDPDQRENEINNPAYRAEIKRLQDILMDYMVKTNDPQLDNYKTLLAGGTCNVQTIAPKGKEHKEHGDGI